ncbi:lactosylceramide 4-alpha-galactosyltransferase-like [Onthophagus taurus]|uniref:lactosylceramide 4-alpha-galactosyltransferase-like n=1 Tax=Onthophagus taurus TaxID=166361 RepID=UPI0039BDA852
MNYFIRCFVVIISLGLFYLASYWLLVTNNTTSVSNKHETTSKESPPILKNLFDLVVKENSIFFLETSMKDFEHEVVTINRRASCALESAALHHQNRTIYYIYVFPNDTETIYIKEKYLNMVLTYENIQVVYAKIDDLVRNTEIEELFSKHLIETSPFFVEHFSDAFRAIILMKFGGIYMDSDVIVLKSLDDLGGNFIGKEISTILASGIMGFDENGIDLLSAALEDLNKNYNPKSWGGHGPLLFTKWVKKMCNATANFSYHECDYLRILPTNAFYPVSYGIWRHFFNPKYIDEIRNMVKNSYLIHIWNKLTHGFILEADSNAPYLIFAREHCPKTVSKLYKSF